MAKHRNSGKCEKCLELINEWGIHSALRKWFTLLQEAQPDVHLCYVGRGQDEQEKMFLAGATRAHFGQSPHNFTPALAVDMFRLVVEPGKPDQASFNIEWYREIAKKLPAGIAWGGNFRHFVDSPHFEIAGWQDIPGKSLIWKKDMSDGNA